MFSSTPRDTGNPVTPIDIVGGRRWEVRGNFIHDHAKLGSDQVSYAAFFKGNSRDGLFERNLVVCELLHSGQIRLGLSFGGEGSDPNSICEEGTCTPEHRGGVMRNNLIVSCPTDVGIYLNEAADARVYNNTLYRTTGIDVRFQASTVDLRNNLLDGWIRDRDGGTSARAGNLEGVADADLRAWFADPSSADFSLRDGSRIIDLGVAADGVRDDYCGAPREDGHLDIGAVEYHDGRACDTTRPPRAAPEQPEPVEDAGVPGEDAAVSGEDAAVPGEDAAAPGGDAAAPGEDSGRAGRDAAAHDVAARAPDSGAEAPRSCPPCAAAGACPDDGCSCRLRPRSSWRGPRLILRR